MSILRRILARLGHNLAWKIAALLASLALWVAINGSEPNADRFIRLAVRPFGLPKRLVIADHFPGAVEVELRGPRSILRTIDESDVRVPLDLRDARPGTKSIKLSPELLSFPRRVRVVRMDPAHLELHIERLLKKTVPVKPVLVPAERNGYTISGVAVMPGEVEVSGPASHVQGVQLVETEPVSTLGVQGAVEREVSLASTAERLAFFPEAVRVGFAVKEVEARRTFTALAVAIRGARGVAAIHPAAVAATVRGPQHRLLNLELGDGAAYVDASGLDIGVHVVSVRMEIGDGFAVDDVSPATVELRVGVLPGGPAPPAEARRPKDAGGRR